MQRNMNLWTTRALVVSLVLLIGAAWIARADDATSVSLENLNWLVGHWQGRAFGGDCEETWTTPSNGSMLGMYKQSMNGAVQFYELMTLTEDSSGIVMTLKHFNADMTGWEEKDEVETFAFRQLLDGKLVLDGLIYESTGEDSLLIQVSVGSSDGSAHVESIRLKRAAD